MREQLTLELISQPSGCIMGRETATRAVADAAGSTEPPGKHQRRNILEGMSTQTGSSLKRGEGHRNKCRGIWKEASRESRNRSMAMIMETTQRGHTVSRCHEETTGESEEDLRTSPTARRANEKENTRGPRPQEGRENPSCTGPTRRELAWKGPTEVLQREAERGMDH